MHQLWAVIAVAAAHGLSLARAAWVDTDTPRAAHSTFSLHTGQEYRLVMSDEFEKEATTKNDYTNAALHYYHKDKVTTTNGYLNITTTNEDIEFDYWDERAKRFKTMTKVYKSGMVQGWNKFCFTGGIVEVSAALPGEAYIGGLWPAIWLLGNLARATYTSSSDYTWPWSYDRCDRSDAEHAAHQIQQEISACDALKHFDMKPFTGRGAPEIDVLEAMPGRDPYSEFVVGKPYISTSFQVSPGTERKRPVLGKFPQPGMWYEDGIEYGKNTSQNLYFYGSKLIHDPPSRTYWADAISANHALSPTHFNKQHIYRLEWQGGAEGYLRWYIDGAFVYGMTQGTFNRTGAKVPDEPMYLLFNTAVSSMWGFPAPCPKHLHCSCDCWDARDSRCQCAIPKNMGELFPAHFLIDYVRVYQNPSHKSQHVGCDPESAPTAKWIAGHASYYMDPSDTTYEYPVPHGGARCRHGRDCGGGACVRRSCRCNEHWTGPNCRAPAGSDDQARIRGVKDVIKALLPPEHPRVPKALAGRYC
ncbi:beta-1,6-glucan active enzyme, family GH16 [Tribonema minus]|uniref:Beta-1,6-glucan active enzyme, family GH16 n=1 Tax=Tribonema minus TaxID=303371 RepID=A0A835YPV8_9STRA|nr:beta-1,6-glucan active enzyme, family GH16 [Tribonema minus]